MLGLHLVAYGQNEPDSIMEVTLPELVFTESLIKHRPKSDVFKITENHRKGMTHHLVHDSVQLRQQHS